MTNHDPNCQFCKGTGNHTVYREDGTPLGDTAAPCQCVKQGAEMTELEGSMHSHAANPEPEPVFVVCCAECEEELYVGYKAVRLPEDGIVCPDCWRDWQLDQTFKRMFTLEHDTVTDGG